MSGIVTRVQIVDQDATIGIHNMIAKMYRIRTR